MTKVSGKVQAKSWQPTPKPHVQKSGFAVRPFPSLDAQQEKSSQSPMESKAGPEISMLANVNRATIATYSTTTSPGMTVQAKLTIGAPGDKYEQEADRVAKQVVQRLQAPASPPVAPPTGEGSEPTVQRQVAIPIMQRVTAGIGGSQGPMPADAGFEAQLQRSRSGGSPLDAEFRAKVEPLMGADFSGVRVHTDGNSDRLARSIQAKAFTTGQDMYFSSGAYEPGSRGGQELLAHELTHVVQQGGGNSEVGMNKFDPSPEMIVQCNKRWKLLYNSYRRSITQNNIPLFLNNYDRDGNELRFLARYNRLRNWNVNPRNVMAQYILLTNHLQGIDEHGLERHGEQNQIPQLYARNNGNMRGLFFDQPVPRAVRASAFLSPRDQLHAYERARDEFQNWVGEVQVVWGGNHMRANYQRHTILLEYDETIGYISTLEGNVRRLEWSNRVKVIIRYQQNNDENENHVIQARIVTSYPY